jgi:hypothetical protein
MPLRGGRIWLAEGQIQSVTKGTQRMQLVHTVSRSSVVFDEPNLLSAAGLVPVLVLAERAGLRARTSH